MRSPEEVAAFENALAELAENPQPEDLPSLHLVLDDLCQHQEVMFSLVHFLETFDVKEQLQAFVAVVPQLIVIAPEWTRVIHDRILNDESVCKLYQEILHEVNSKSQNFFCQLLEDSAKSKLNQLALYSELAAR
ncbi:MAG: Imm30 family immunity protein [Coleofasciculaceae cyanobacterium]